MLFSFLIPSGGSAPACTLKDGTPVPGYRLCCMRCSFVCHLVEDVVTDDQSVTAIVTSEVGHVSYIGDTGDGFLPDSYTVFTLPFSAGVNCPEA